MRHERIDDFIGLSEIGVGARDSRWAKASAVIKGYVGSGEP